MTRLENHLEDLGSATDLQICMSTSGGSRIPRRRGHQHSGEGAPTYDFAKFCEKLHEIEKNVGPWGGGGRLALAGGAPVNPPLVNQWRVQDCAIP